MHSSLEFILFRMNTSHYSSYCTKLQAVFFVSIQNPWRDYSGRPSDFSQYELIEYCNSLQSKLTLSSMLLTMKKLKGYIQSRQKIILNAYKELINGASHGNFEFRLALVHIPFLIS